MKCALAMPAGLNDDSVVEQNRDFLAELFLRLGI